MTANHARKNAVRRQMAETGTTYTTAARATSVLAAPPPPGGPAYSRDDSADRGAGTCIFCGAAGIPASVEHVIPKWARRAFDISGWVTVTRGESGSADRAGVGQMQHLNIILRDSICEPCNNGWLSDIEKKAARILRPLAVDAAPTALDPGAQALVALWAVKTGLLLELAWRQMYPGTRAVPGYEATAQELAWLRAHSEPPPRSMVWLGSWDCQKEIPVRYEPSAAEMPTADGSELAGHLTTFTLGFAAFQIFTVDFLAAEQHGAPVWNTRPPETMKHELARIWPRQLHSSDLAWPPPPFAHDNWRRLVTWDEKLRP
jgi:hypothetical protein